MEQELGDNVLKKRLLILTPATRTRNDAIRLMFTYNHTFYVSWFKMFREYLEAKQ